MVWHGGARNWAKSRNLILHCCLKSERFHRTEKDKGLIFCPVLSACAETRNHIASWLLRVQRKTLSLFIRRLDQTVVYFSPDWLAVASTHFPLQRANKHRSIRSFFPSARTHDESDRWFCVNTGTFFTTDHSSFAWSAPHCRSLPDHCWYVQYTKYFL